jgi:hypothetical protein
MHYQSHNAHNVKVAHYASEIALYMYVLMRIMLLTLCALCHNAHNAKTYNHRRYV